MEELSPEELIELGARFGVEVSAGEAERLATAVRTKVEGFGDPYELPVGVRGTGGDRSWREPTDDPYNGVAVACSVPPSDDGVLSGLAAGVKDAIAVAGVPMAAGSDVLYGYVPGRDATAVRRLRRAGATITAKTTLDEFAASPRATTGRDGPVRNPHDPDRIAGGSSGGSAVVVATGRVDVALGTDTGGSVRGPAAFCGVLGLKPTYGLVPLSGVVENTYTLDHVGPVSRTVEAMARTLEAIAGKDEGDPASMAAAGRDAYRVGGYVDAVASPPAVEELVVGRLEQGFGDGIDDAIETATREAIDALEDDGATVEPVSVPGIAAHQPLKDYISYPEVAAHWRAGGAPFRRGGDVDDGYQAALARRTRAGSRELGEFYKTKLLAGAYMIERDGGRRYTRAQRARRALTREFKAAIEGVDVVVLPTMGGVAPPVEESASPGFDTGRNTRIGNLTGLPALTMPNGTVDDLPIGLQVMAPAFDEATLLGAAAAIEDFLGGAPSP